MPSPENFSTYILQDIKGQVEKKKKKIYKGSQVIAFDACKVADL